MRPEIPTLRTHALHEHAVREFGGTMSLAIQAISLHPLLIGKEYPFLPSSNERDATSLADFPMRRLFLLDACFLHAAWGASSQ
jgi:hypothetical protein